jgi:acetoin utilization protein AcuB
MAWSSRTSWTSKLATADVHTSIRAVMNRLQDLDIRHLPIVEDERLVGIISDRDLREVTSRLIGEGARHGEALLDGPISDVMSTDVVSVDAETELEEVVDLMIEHRVGALPVVTPGTEELVGIVSYVDVLRAARDTL